MKKHIKKCKTCRGILFIIINMPSCDNCDENGAWDDDKDDFIFNSKIIKRKELERNHVSEQGECNLGTSNDSGCHLYKCFQCHSITNIPVQED